MNKAMLYLLTFFYDTVPEIFATSRVVFEGITYHFLNGLLRTIECLDGETEL